MKERLQPTHHRHVFAFLHPAVVEEPLIAVQVALTKGITGSVDAILGRRTPLADPRNTSRAAHSFQAHAARPGPNAHDKELVDTAIFYTINSAQSALRGMDMGNMLIKRVVREVQENLNASRCARNLIPIQRFSTLSPIPGYVRWLAEEADRLQKQVSLHAAALTRGKPLATEAGSACRVFGVTPPEELERRYYAPLRAAIRSYIDRTTDTTEGEGGGAHGTPAVDKEGATTGATPAGCQDA